MPQILFPFFPDGLTHINPNIAFKRKEGRIEYYNGASVFARHDEADYDAFKAKIGELCAIGLVTQAEAARAFGVTSTSLKRATKLYLKSGTKGFFAARRTRGPAVLTSTMLGRAQELLNQGIALADVADQLGLKRNTAAKAVRDGRLRNPVRLIPSETPPVPPTSSGSKSHRSAEDSNATMGTGATDTLGRVAASLGQLEEATANFQAALDVPNGGVLLALPALQAMGLLNAKKHFKLPKGYYGVTSIFLLLAFMALARLKSLERLRYCAPGEWGKLLGLDRVPEVRTMRNKVKLLACEDKAAEWSADLCRDWMGESPEQATAYYIDGHVRVYHGDKAQLPKTYVAREKLCLSASTDYWVNAMDGQPFFVVYQGTDPGLIQVLEDEIVPRLERDVPNQPTNEELEGDPLRPRFTVIFDRAGYSPGLFRRLKSKRIACLTYRRSPGDDWAETEFFSQTVELVSGNNVEMRLAERGTLLGTKKDEKVWVREIRRLMPGGHQTSVVSTDFQSDPGPLAGKMFARWCQENFFKYMKENYGLDRMASYSIEDIPDTTKVVNPEHRGVEREIRTKAATLSRRMAEYGTLQLSMDEKTEPKSLDAQIQKRATLHEEIQGLELEIVDLKQKRKAIPRHIPVSELPEGQKLERLSVGTRQLLDTVKMIAYRAETAMAQTIQGNMSRSDDARNLLRAIYANEVDLLPEPDNLILRVRLHRLANRSSDNAAAHLCRELNETETIFPGTELRLVYEMVSRPDATEPSPEAGTDPPRIS
jgi:transposase-like protein